MMPATQVTIEATINAPKEQIWDMWTKPSHIVQWNFASDDWCCPSADVDLKVGGRYRARMEAKDGSFGFDFEATYDEVIFLKKIVYTMDDGRKATTTFDAQGSKTKIKTVFDAEKTHPVEMQKEGWQAILNNFKKHVEAAL